MCIVVQTAITRSRIQSADTFTWQWCSFLWMILDAFNSLLHCISNIMYVLIFISLVGTLHYKFRNLLYVIIQISVHYLWGGMAVVGKKPGCLMVWEAGRYIGKYLKKQIAQMLLRKSWYHGVWNGPVACWQWLLAMQLPRFNKLEFRWLF